MPSIKDLIDHLEASKTKPAKFAMNTRGPIRQLFEVDFARLQNASAVPSALTSLIVAISSSMMPYDKGQRTSRNDETMGAMRQIHSNDPAWLPDISVASNSLNVNQDLMEKNLGRIEQIEADAKKSGANISKNVPYNNLKDTYDDARSATSMHAMAYNEYAVQNKKQTNDNGGSNAATGYIEYTASEPGMYDPEPPLRSRIVYNYIANIIYFSPLHYHSWTFNGDHPHPAVVSGKSTELTASHPNAFYIITQVSRPH
jgi:hypothetical protein